jgi:hypothetical protein
MSEFHRAIATATTVADLETVVSEPALAIAMDLDAKIESLLETAAR